VFNIADSSIFVGVVAILVLQRKFFKEKEQEKTFPNIDDSVSPPAQDSDPVVLFKPAEDPRRDSENDKAQHG
jgi:hypothetical protein